METLSQRLKRLRIKKGLSQAEFAANVGVSASTYRDWEYGKKIKGEPYLALATALDVDLVYLLLGESRGTDEVLNQLRELERMIKNIRKTVLTF